uniref:Uncharacterized protein n=1 Tax=Arion vulgaris TaxID=1028688 RepID=A0A0B7B2B6_9EUPU
MITTASDMCCCTFLVCVEVTITALRLPQLQLGTRETLRTQGVYHHVNHIPHKVLPVKENYESNNVFPNISLGNEEMFCTILNTHDR